MEEKDCYIFKSKFASYINSFLKEKKQKGLSDTKVLKGFMLEFDKFFQEYSITDLNITEDIILQWRNTRISESKRTLYYKYTAWVNFCRYLCSIGIECYIPRTPREGSQNDYIPYIYTSQEIELIFKAVDKLRIDGNKNTTTMFFMPAICRLLYSTGMRISEALSLKNEDLVFDKRLIYINRAKNGQQRLAVMNDSLFLILKEYKEFRNFIPVHDINSPDKYFFTTQLGEKCSAGSVRVWFHKALYYADIPKQTYVNRPRIHDLRHTAAVHSLQKLISLGADIHSEIPLISMFLGHKNIKSTAHYIRLTTQMFPDLIKIQSKTAFVFPDMKFINTNDL
ncbi:tyrosine-type recombinase/integrase [Chryseobacterium polytrichastri]|uniref:Site-specific recombinase XerD n=1 Tax=Chryseobacterium polytrichastri TaxID=1302687 RepID=A0A1M7BU49_9FLAO|nr:tyrosine-type recombinase/integrase [Chryseobacterium polytrichastri]SHL58510.1 Site-specific recombinase XerD [Chryseobacterium polytrichastri]